MQTEQVVGIIAGIFTGVSLLPQLIKIIKEKNADGVSSGMLGILSTGLAVWVYYGILREDYPVIITNVFSFSVNVLIIILSFKYKNRKQSR